MAGLLKGKTALIMGARNKWSIAWAIAEAYAAQGAKLILTYQGDREEKDVRELAKLTGGALTMNCDVTDSEQVEGVFERVGKERGTLDVMAGQRSVGVDKCSALGIRRTALDRDIYCFVHHLGGGRALAVGGH